MLDQRGLPGTSAQWGQRADKPREEVELEQRLIRPKAYSSTHCQGDALRSWQIAPDLRGSHASSFGSSPWDPGLFFIIIAKVCFHLQISSTTNHQLWSKVTRNNPPRTHRRTEKSSTCTWRLCSLHHLRIPLVHTIDRGTRTAQGIWHLGWAAEGSDNLCLVKVTAQPDYAASSGHGGSLLSSRHSSRSQNSSLQEFHDRGDPDWSPGAQGFGSGRGAAQIRSSSSAVRPAFS